MLLWSCLLLLGCSPDRSFSYRKTDAGDNRLTHIQDTLNFSVLSISPAPNRADVQPDENLILSFSSPVDDSSIEWSLFPDCGCLSLSLDSSKQKLTLKHRYLFTNNTVYQLKLTAKSLLSGTYLSAPLHFSFKVAQPLVALPFVPRVPQIISTTLNPEKQILPVAGSFDITFSEPMDKESVKQSLKITPDVDLDFSWNQSSTILTCSYKQLMNGQVYQIKLSKKTRAINGQTLEMDQQWRLKTRGPPVIYEISVANMIGNRQVRLGQGLVPIVLTGQDLVISGVTTNVLDITVSDLLVSADAKQISFNINIPHGDRIITPPAKEQLQLFLTYPAGQIRLDAFIQVTPIIVSSLTGDDGTGIGTYQNPFKTLTKALTVTNTNDVIELKEGTYNEASFQIKSNLLIRGAGIEKTILQGSQNSTGFTTHADNFYLQNLKMSGFTTALKMDNGQSTLNSVWIDTSRENAIECSGSANLILNKVKVTNTANHPITVSGNAVVSMDYSFIYNNGSGLSFSQSSKGFFYSGNLITKNATLTKDNEYCAIMAKDSSIIEMGKNATMRNVVAYNTGCGIFASDETSVTVNRTDVNFNGTSFATFSQNNKFGSGIILSGAYFTMNDSSSSFNKGPGVWLELDVKSVSIASDSSCKPNRLDGDSPVFKDTRDIKDSPGPTFFRNTYLKNKLYQDIDNKCGPTTKGDPEPWDLASSGACLSIAKSTVDSCLP